MGEGMGALEHGGVAGLLISETLQEC